MEFKDYKIIKENNQAILCLYLRNANFNLESGSEFNLDKQEQLKKDALSYVKKKRIFFTGKKIRIFLGAALITTLAVSFNSYLKDKEENASNQLYPSNQKTILPENNLGKKMTLDPAFLEKEYFIFNNDQIDR